MAKRIAVYILLALVIGGGVLGFSYYSASHPKPSVSLSQKPVQEVLDLAAQGDAEAQYLTGWRYQFGDDGLPGDYEKAADWYRRAAEQDHPKAQNQLGLLYNQGLGVEKDYRMALHWYRKAADQGHKTSMANVGNAYYEGNGVAQDYKEAAQWYRRAAELGFVPAQRLLGEMHFEGKGVPQDNAEGLKWLRAAAENGDKTAQYNLSMRYRKGDSVEKDFTQSGYWYRKVADQGDTEAQAFLGKSSLICDENPDNPTREEYCLFAAGAGDPNAQFTIGTYYDSGHYTGEDYKKATEWFRKPAEQGHILSQSMLGRAYDTGRGVEENDVEAYAWLSLTARRTPKTEAEEFAVTGSETVKGIVLERLTNKQKQEAKQRAEELWKMFGKPFNSGD
jgi:TPR repeat protein